MKRWPGTGRSRRPDRATLLECIQKRYRPWSGIQLCAARLYGRFLSDCNELSPRLVNYINQQLELPPSLSIPVPVRRQTRWQYQKVLLGHIGFRPFDDSAQTTLEDWLDQQARQGALPATLFHRAERRLLTQRCMLPGPSVLERLVIRVCSTAHVALFKSIHHCLSPPLREAIERLLDPAEGDQRSMFYQLKAYPPSASISSIQHYLEHYTALANTHLEDVESPSIDPAFLDYLFKLARRYNANDVKHFDEHKRYAMMICFLLESRKVILDHLVKMHDQSILDLCRPARLAHEKQHRMLRERLTRAIDTVLATTDLLLDWSDNQPLTKAVLWQRVDEHALRSSIEYLRVFKRLEERGYGAMLLSRYPSMRKYFAQFIQLPFAADVAVIRYLKASNWCANSTVASSHTSRPMRPQTSCHGNYGVHSRTTTASSIATRGRWGWHSPSRTPSVRAISTCPKASITCRSGT